MFLRDASPVPIIGIGVGPDRRNGVGPFGRFGRCKSFPVTVAAQVPSSDLIFSAAFGGRNGFYLLINFLGPVPTSELLLTNMFGTR